MIFGDIIKEIVKAKVSFVNKENNIPTHVFIPSKILRLIETHATSILAYKTSATESELAGLKIFEVVNIEEIKVGRL